MKRKDKHYNQMTELRRREMQIATKPCAEAYVELANEYLAIGLNKEYDRLLQKAESVEEWGRPFDPHASNALLSGAANQVMLVEVIQTLSRTPLSGDLVIVTPTEGFHIYFHEGWIINATSQTVDSGLDSLQKALTTTSGTYGFYEKNIAQVDRLIFESTDTLLLHVMQHADETMP